MKSLLIFFLLCYSARSQDYLDLDTLWVSGIGGNPIGFSHDDSQILLTHEGYVNHIDANTGEYLFRTEGTIAYINPVQDYYITRHSQLQNEGEEIPKYRPYILYRHLNTGEVFDTIWFPNDVGVKYIITTIVISPDGTKLAATGHYHHPDDPHNIEPPYLTLVYDLNTKQALSAINFYQNVFFFSKDNQHIYAVPRERDDENKLKKININTGEVVKTFEYTRIVDGELKTSKVQNAWLSDEGNYFFVSSGSGLFAYNSANDEELFSFKHSHPNFSTNTIEKLISNENRNLIVSSGRAEIGTAGHRDTRIWNLTDGSHINTIWYNPGKFDGTDGWVFLISNKQNSKTLFLRAANSSNGGNKMFCITNFWENPIINSVPNQEPDIRFSEEGNIINIQTQQGDNQITISNLTGAVIQTIPITQPMQVININKQEFTSSAYFISVHSNNSIYNYKFIGSF